MTIKITLTKIANANIRIWLRPRTQRRCSSKKGHIRPKTILWDASVYAFHKFRASEVWNLEQHGNTMQRILIYSWFDACLTMRSEFYFDVCTTFYSRGKPTNLVGSQWRECKILKHEKAKFCGSRLQVLQEKKVSTQKQLRTNLTLKKYIFSNHVINHSPKTVTSL